VVASVQVHRIVLITLTVLISSNVVPGKGYWMKFRFI